MRDSNFERLRPMTSIISRAYTPTDLDLAIYLPHPVHGGLNVLSIVSET